MVSNEVGEPIDEILKGYEGQDAFVVIEVLTVDPKTKKPLTGCVVDITSEPDEAGLAARKTKHAMIRWVGRRAELIILNAHVFI